MLLNGAYLFPVLNRLHSRCKTTGRQRVSGYMYTLIAYAYVLVQKPDSR